MRFSGRLQIEADPHNWLKADLMVARGRVELVAGSDLLGSWPTSQVAAERVEADRFSLQLGEDRALFIADDALGFSYEAMPQLNKRQLIPVGGVMDKLKAGFRGDDHRETPTAPNESPGAGPVESAVTTTGKRLRDLIREASGYSTAAAETPVEPAGEKKAGHTLDAVLRWRSGAEDDATIVSEGLGGVAELSTEDLLERLFDAPDASEPDRPFEESPTPGPLWAEPAAEAEPMIIPDPPAVAEVTVLTDPPLVARPPVGTDSPRDIPPPVAGPDLSAKPPLETWQREQPPLEVWHKTEQPVDLSPSLDSHWGQKTREWPSTFESETGDSQSTLLEALDLIVADVKSGAMSAEQVQAITTLVEAVRKAVQPKF